MRRTRTRRRCSRGGGLAVSVRATGCSCWRRWRKRRKGRPKTSAPPLAPSPRGTRRKGRRRRAPGRRRRGSGGRRRAPAGSRASTPSTTPSPSSGACRASSPASRGRSRTCRTWRSPAPPAARTCWPSRRTPSTSAAGSCAAAPSGGSPPPRSPRCRPSSRPSRPSTSATTASSTAAAADHQPIPERVRTYVPTCTDEIRLIDRSKREKHMHIYACKLQRELVMETTLLGRRETRWMDGWMDGSHFVIVRDLAHLGSHQQQWPPRA